MRKLTSARSLALGLVVFGLACVDARSPFDHMLAMLPVIRTGDLQRLAVDSTIIHNVRDIAVVGDDVWVLNSSAPYFARFRRADGALEMAAGAAGEGPREWRMPLRFLAAESGEIWAYDTANRALRRLGRDGSTTAEIAIPVVRAGEALRLSTFGESIFLAEFGDGLLVSSPPRTGVSGGRDIWQVEFVHLPWQMARAETADVVNSAVRQIESSLDPDAPPETFEIPIDPRSALSRLSDIHGVAMFYISVPLWTTCGTDEFLYLDTTEETLWARTAQDGQYKSVRLPLPSGVEMTEDLILDIGFREAAPRNWREAGVDSLEIRRTLRQAVRQESHRFPRVSGSVARMLCDDRGRVWLQRVDFSSDSRGYGSEWLVWSRKEDAYIGRLALPPSVKVYEIRRDSLWVVYRDEVDRQWPAVIPLVEGSSIR